MVALDTCPPKAKKDRMLNGIEVTGVDINYHPSYTHECDNCFTVRYNKVVNAGDE